VSYSHQNKINIPVNLGLEMNSFSVSLQGYI